MKIGVVEAIVVVAVVALVAVVLVVNVVGVAVHLKLLGEVTAVPKFALMTLTTLHPHFH